MSRSTFVQPPGIAACVAFALALFVAPPARSDDPPPVAATVPQHHPHVAPRPSTLPAARLVGEATARLGRAYGGTKVDVTTYHYDTNRTGWNPTETDLTPATVASAKFGLLATLAVDGVVLAQPLLASGLRMPDGARHDVLIIATANNSVYAFDAQSYASLWHVSLGPAQSDASVDCTDVHPQYGVSGTPVIVRTATRALLYLVAASAPQAGQFIASLHALDVATGQATVPVATIAASATLSDGSVVRFNPQSQYVRAGLAYHGGSLYVGISSHCDRNASTTTGWLLRYDTSTLHLQHAFNTVQSHHGTELASIWMSGFAPAIDTAGNVFVVTGNGDFTPGKNDWGQSALKLNTGLTKVLSSFTPGGFLKLNSNDGDFGAGGIMLLPQVAGQTAPPLAVAMGKSSVLYLLNQASLGGESATDAGALQTLPASGAGLWGGPAFYDGPSGPMVYTQTGGDLLHGWAVGIGTAAKLTLAASGASRAGFGGSLPIVSSNGAAAKTGVVWLVNRATAPMTLEAYDAVALGAPIFQSRVGEGANDSGGNAYITPMQANGRVYVASNQRVDVFGLTP